MAMTVALALPFHFLTGMQGRLGCVYLLHSSGKPWDRQHVTLGSHSREMSHRPFWKLKGR